MKPRSQAVSRRSGRERTPRKSVGETRNLFLAILALVACLGASPRLRAQELSPEPVAPTEAMLESVPTAPSEDAAGLRRFALAKFDSGHLAWTMIGTIAALFMLTPGLALFYCGLVNRENAPRVLLEYLFLGAILSLSWVLWMYSLAFSRYEH